MCLRSLGFALLLLAPSPACDSADPPAEAIATPQTAAPPPTEDNAPLPPSKASIGSAEIAELEAMCAAVDHDYIDGTLSDYFRDVKSQTDWGKGVQAKADESTTPGRVLLAAMKDAGVAETDKRLPACGRIFEYIDDVE